tara:strand:+ start:8223 stop:9221 length:999 start_codon:yes stop_codon:yes gene_type:complete
MGRKISPGAKYIHEVMDQFPKTPSLTLAKKIYKDNPAPFKSVESIRTIIRIRRGQHGDWRRKATADKSNFTKPGSTNPFNLPEPVDENFEPHYINETRILIISDLHFPYQDNKAITAALKYGLEMKVNAILINGDLIDFAAISRHERDWRQRMPHEEFEAARQFLFGLRKAFPKANIVYKEGNHCERWMKWLFIKAPELFNDPEFRLDVRLRLGELKIQHVGDRRPVNIGKLTVLHGHETFGGSGGVNPARSMFLKMIDNVLVGHFHRTSSHVERTAKMKVISVQSMGCLCTLNPYYMRYNKHNHGFVYVEHNFKTGEYYLHNKMIDNGKVY